MIGTSTTTAVWLVGQSLLAAGSLGRRGGRVGGGEALTYLLIAGGIIALICGSIAVVTRLQRHRRESSHGGLFHGLCRLHNLDSRSRRLLKQLARQHRLAQPARLFCEPKWLNPASLPAPLRQRAGEVKSLRNRLFG